MIDRFGLLPDPTRNLFAVARLKLKANTVGVKRIDAGPRGGRLEFEEGAKADVDGLLSLVHGNPSRYRLKGPTQLQLLDGEDDDGARIEAIEQLLDQLGARAH